MTGKKQSITVTNSTVHSSAVGIGHVEQHGGTVSHGVDVATLLAALNAQADRIVAQGQDDDARAELAVDLRKIRRELESGTPDATVVRTRWQSVQDVLGSAATAVGGIATITEHITALFGS